MKLEVKGRGGVELLVEVFVLTVDGMFELGVGRRKAWKRRLCRPKNMSLLLSKPTEGGSRCRCGRIWRSKVEPRRSKERGGRPTYPGWDVANMSASLHSTCTNTCLAKVRRRFPPRAVANRILACSLVRRLGCLFVDVSDLRQALRGTSAERDTSWHWFRRASRSSYTATSTHTGG